MKCTTFYEDQCCTSCFDSGGTKNTERPSYDSTCHFLYFYYDDDRLQYVYLLKMGPVGVAA